jgi:Fibronectin type III domain
MATPTKDSSSSSTQLVVDWTALTSPDNGDSTITSYNLKWDAGTSGVTWTTLIGYSPSSTALTYSVTSGLTVGSSYQFKVRA